MGRLIAVKPRTGLRAYFNFLISTMTIDVGPLFSRTKDLSQGTENCNGQNDFHRPRRHVPWTDAVSVLQPNCPLTTTSLLLRGVSTSRDDVARTSSCRHGIGRWPRPARRSSAYEPADARKLRQHSGNNPAHRRLCWSPEQWRTSSPAGDARGLGMLWALLAGKPVGTMTGQGTALGDAS